MSIEQAGQRTTPGSRPGPPPTPLPGSRDRPAERRGERVRIGPTGERGKAGGSRRTWPRITTQERACATPSTPPLGRTRG